MNLTEAQEKDLIGLAVSSIRHGLSHGSALPKEDLTRDEELLQPGAAFVTLEKHGMLRGCIGSVEAYKPLAEDVVENAWNAAFRDPRFPQLQLGELEQLELEISILSEATPMHVRDEQDLLAQLVPHRDGLILEDGYHRGLFLPAVWEKLPDPQEFLTQLKLKAGLSSHHWSKNMVVKRFSCHEFRGRAH